MHSSLIPQERIFVSHCLFSGLAPSLNRAPITRMRASRFSLLTAALMVLGLASAPGCGSDDDEKPAPKKEEKGQPRQCGDLTCEAVELLPGYDPIEACCTADNQCGLDGSRFEDYGADFADPCQARNQPGVLDPTCPDTGTIQTEAGLSFSFKGCCTAESRCGYMVDDVANIITLGLGCVGAEPFLEGGTPKACGDGAGGAGGGSGQ